MRILDWYKEFNLTLVALWSSWVTIGSLAENVHVIPRFVPLLLLLSGIWPCLALGFFVAVILPFGGDYPGSPAIVFFMRCVAALALGLILRRWFMASGPFSRGPSSPQPLFLMAVLFSISALGSLLSLPLDEIYTRFTQLGAHTVSALLNGKETWVTFIIVRAFLVMQCVALIVLAEERFGLKGCLAHYVLGGLMVSYVWVIGLGLAESFGFLQLSSIRPIATGMKSDGTPLRLQSILGHPAWCAMYIGAAAPAIVILFTTHLRAWLRNLLIVLMMILGEYALLLTFARGGWVSYPFTLVCIWICIYWVRSEKKTSTRNRLSRVLVSLPITIIFSLGLLAISEKGDYGRYVERFKAIAHTTDRTVYIQPSLDLFREHPFMGGGVSAFSYRYASEFVIPTGKYYLEGRPLGNTYNNAHSLYMGVLVGQGVFGLFILLGLFVTASTTASKVIFQAKIDRSSDGFHLIGPLTWIALLCASISLALYGVFDDTFYPASNLVLLFLLAGAALQVQETRYPLEKRESQAIIGVALAFLALHFAWEYVYPARAWKLIVDPAADGCYRSTPEIQLGKEVIWCSENAVIDFPIADYKGAKFASVSLMVPHQGKGNRSPVITVKDPKDSSSSLGQFIAPVGQTFWLIIPVKDQGHLPNSVKLQVSSSDYYVPLRDVAMQSLDRRRLAFWIDRTPDAFGHNEDVNVQCVEILDEAKGMGWRDFWCSGQGRISLPGVEFDKADFSVRLPEASAATNPVWIAFGQKGRDTKTMLALADSSRKKFLTDFDLKDPKGLWVSVSLPLVRLDPQGGSGFIIGVRSHQDAGVE